ncbi:FAD-dependent oxidoreductase [Kyrpidia spormannii]|uniref:Pyridine nucleotide-disulfide oxidoreductase n=2 Tax=Kyrpidia spormannii TaxID=2055160 RepID=A0ACA8Z639_9BACL|nr:FAD-dependent oxidoreductase [Kyrpidia spormannii]CAB3389501.1 Pyridine nucleotide-disulfide oxidoreductase [Kyrpidia spormannii]CAB3390290.1 Pyridine nucleotide-disulfide oxidoreductase [Kyrpidia spormannii]
MSTEVIVYTSTGCPYCHRVKEQLSEWDIPFEERNVSKVKEYFDELRAKKIFGTPATLINGKLILGFQPEKMRKALGLEQQAGADAGQHEEKTENQVGAGPEKPVPPEDIFQPVTLEILNEVYDFVSIGGGPAGSSAAVYAARGRLKTLVIDKAPASGTLALTHKIANYPGVRKTMTGWELLAEMQLQAKDFGATFVRTQVLSVDFSNPNEKKVHIPEGVIRAKSVLIAVGAKAPSGKIKGEEEFVGRGVSYCSTCDAAFFENRVVAVAGDSEEAVREAEVLAKFCKEVRLLIPGSELRGEVDLSGLEKRPNVRLYKRYRIKEIMGGHAVERIVVLDGERREQTWEVDGVFLYLAGMKPGTDFLMDQVERDEEGYVVVDEQLRTNVPGVFAGGDARRTPAKQAVVSAADGCVAALGADQFVNGRDKIRVQYS